MYLGLLCNQPLSVSSVHHIHQILPSLLIGLSTQSKDKERNDKIQNNGPKNPWQKESSPIYNESMQEHGPIIGFLRGRICWYEITIIHGQLKKLVGLSIAKFNRLLAHIIPNTLPNGPMLRTTHLRSPPKKVHQLLRLWQHQLPLLRLLQEHDCKKNQVLPTTDVFSLARILTRTPLLKTLLKYTSVFEIKNHRFYSLRFIFQIEKGDSL